MNRQQIDQKVRHAFSAAAPDKLEDILRSCDEQKGTITVMTPKKSASSRLRRLAGVAAAVLLFAVSGAGFHAYQVQNTVASAVSLDVNPSLMIEVNRNQRVLNVDALNNDAEIVLGDMDLRGSELDVAVNALLGSMLREGYLSDLANSILISVDDDDAERGGALQQQLSSQVQEVLKNGGLDAAVLSQTVTGDEQTRQLAADSGISAGKAQLVNQIVTQNSAYTFDELSGLNINQLNLLSSSLDNVKSTGEASEKAYIGREAALAAALKEANLTEQDVTRIEIEMELENGVMVYEVDFRANAMEYDYDIDALTGAVLDAEQEPEDDPEDLSSAEAAVSMEQALEIAFAHAKADAAQVSDLDCEVEHSRGKVFYDIEFVFDGVEYDYDVDVTTGEVLKYSSEAPETEEEDDIDDDDVAALPDKAIGEEAALAAALKHAGLAQTDVTEPECEADTENGDPVYEVEFVAGGIEYDYTVHAVTGEILEFSTEAED